MNADRAVQHPRHPDWYLRAHTKGGRVLAVVGELTRRGD